VCLNPSTYLGKGGRGVTKHLPKEFLLFLRHFSIITDKEIKGYCLYGKYMNNTFTAMNFTDQNPFWEPNRFSGSQEIPSFYGTLRFITMFTTAHHLLPTWAKFMTVAYMTVWYAPLRMILWGNKTCFKGIWLY